MPTATSCSSTACGRGGEAHLRVTRFLALVRSGASLGSPATVHTSNTIPTGAGLASSAAGFAALALAAATVYQLGLDDRQLSCLARRGSGSASRSVFGGSVRWHAGEEDASDPDAASYAEPVADARLDAALLVVLVDCGPKAVSSRDAMRRTQATSPLYTDWLAATRGDALLLRRALASGDWESAGRTVEQNALGMHRTMECAVPPVVYRTPESHRILRLVQRLREGGENVWVTMDAGPNVKVLCPRPEAERLADRLRKDVGRPVLVARPGPGARLLPSEAQR